MGNICSDGNKATASAVPEMAGGSVQDFIEKETSSHEVSRTGTRDEAGRLRRLCRFSPYFVSSPLIQ